MARGKTRRAGSGGGMVRYSTFLRGDQLAALRARHEQTGVPVAEQIRRAVDATLGIKRGRS